MMTSSTTLNVPSRSHKSPAQPIAFGLLFLAVCFAADEGSAQVTTSPVSPTSSTPVTIIVTSVDGCVLHGTISQNGFTFDIQTGYPPCVPGGPPITTSYPVGLLLPGTYTVREVDQFNPSSGRVIGSFVVVAAADSIPVMDAGGLAALALSLTGIAFVALRRFNGA